MPTTNRRRESIEKKRTALLVADCPNCRAWQDDKRGHVTHFRLADGVTHCAPDMWLASRGERTGGTMDALWSAMRAWADQCALAAQFEAQTEAR